MKSFILRMSLAMMVIGAPTFFATGTFDTLKAGVREKEPIRSTIPDECNGTGAYCGCLWTAPNGTKSWYWGEEGITELGCDTPYGGAFGRKAYYIIIQP